MAKIKAVVFDMDGVLIEAKDWHYEALNRALGLFGYTISRYDHLVTFDGLPTRKKLEMLSRERDLPASLHEFINDLKQKYTMEIVHARCKPFFAHEYALSTLKSLGMKTAVASNSVRRTVETMMEKANLLPYFDLLLSNEDVRAAKPDPEMYLRAIAELGVSPEETLVLEDNEKGIEAARRSGAHVMVVQQITDVNYAAIAAHIQRIENA